MDSKAPRGGDQPENADKLPTSYGIVLEEDYWKSLVWSALQDIKTWPASKFGLIM